MSLALGLACETRGQCTGFNLIACNSSLPCLCSGHEYKIPYPSDFQIKISYIICWGTWVRLRDKYIIEVHDLTLLTWPVRNRQTTSQGLFFYGPAWAGLQSSLNQASVEFELSYSRATVKFELIRAWVELESSFGSPWVELEPSFGRLLSSFGQAWNELMLNMKQAWIEHASSFGPVTVQLQSSYGQALVELEFIFGRALFELWSSFSLCRHQ